MNEKLRPKKCAKEKRKLIFLGKVSSNIQRPRKKCENKSEFYSSAPY